MACVDGLRCHPTLRLQRPLWGGSLSSAGRVRLCGHSCATVHPGGGRCGSVLVLGSRRSTGDSSPLGSLISRWGLPRALLLCPPTPPTTLHTAWLPWATCSSCVWGHRQGLGRLPRLPVNASPLPSAVTRADRPGCRCVIPLGLRVSWELPARPPISFAFLPTWAVEPVPGAEDGLGLLSRAGHSDLALLVLSCVTAMAWVRGVPTEAHGREWKVFRGKVTLRAVTSSGDPSVWWTADPSGLLGGGGGSLGARPCDGLVPVLVFSLLPSCHELSVLPPPCPCAVVPSHRRPEQWSWLTTGWT